MMFKELVQELLGVYYVCKLDGLVIVFVTGTTSDIFCGKQPDWIERLE